MGRRPNSDFIAPWKVNLPATLAAQVEMRLFDDLTKKPRYGARAKLLEQLLVYWLARENGTPEDQLPPFPSMSTIMSI